MTVAVGEILAGKYKVERILAKGGMGVVVAAIHTTLAQRVALKFLLPGVDANAEARGRFLREARAAVRLRSEHVARVLDVGTADEDVPYIVMEYLEGQDLAQLLAERTRLAVAEAVGYVLQAAEAVAEAHALGIIHRDLKPANLFLTQRPDGSACVKVLDFGISKTTDGAGSMTQTRAVVGTPHYLSPEQVRSSRSADVRSDIWAMGMILYELTTGVVAFPRETLPELCTAIILDPIPPPREVIPDMPEELEGIIGWALSKAPENRPQSLAELAAALAPFAEGGAAAAARIGRILGEAPGPSSDRAIVVPSDERVSTVAPTARPPATPPAGGAPPAPSDASPMREAEGEASASLASLPTRSPWRAIATGGIAVVVIVAAVVTLRTHGENRTPLAPQTALPVTSPPPARALPDAAPSAVVLLPAPAPAPAESPAPEPMTSIRSLPRRPLPPPPRASTGITDFGTRK